MVISHNFYMNLALNEAWKYQLLTYPNPAVGALVTAHCGKILSIEAHQRAGYPHAEVLALQKAYYQLRQDEKILELTDSHEIHEYLLENHQHCFYGCEIYTTLEPCSHIGKTPSCANLIKVLGLKRVYIGSKDFNDTAANGAELLRESGIEVIEGIAQKGCDDLLIPFQKYLEGRFVFFKWAQRLDGSTNDGTITSLASRELVHKMRDVCDLLVIGGNTVRMDRPTLDARLCDGKAPDILIYSKEKEFDRTIPLFNVEGRKVYISDTLDMIQDYKCVMIEGSQNMFEVTRDIVDLHVSFIASTMKPSDGFRDVDAEFEILHTQKIKNDLLLWMKQKDKDGR